MGFDGLVLKQDGEGWTRMTFNSGAEFYGVCGFGPEEVYLVGSEGAILKFDGVNFTEMPSQTMEFILDVWGPSRDMVFAVGDEGMILYLMIMNGPG